MTDPVTNTVSGQVPRPGQRFVFIGGLHRSGTTPLARTLAAHPQVSGFHETGAMEDEGQYLQSVYPTAAARTRSGPGRFALSPAAHITETSPLADPANRDRLIADWSRYWDLDREFLVEKSPANLVMTRFLQKLFPEARFIVIMRHPAIVTLSTKKWAPRTRLSTLFENWFRAHDLLREDAASIGHLHLLTYESLVASPGETLDRVRDFLGLSGPIPTGAVQDRSGGYRSRWLHLAEATDPFNRRRFRRLCERFEDRANAYGYSLTDIDRVPPADLSPRPAA
ncbi:sulfotransferase family protein [Streptomyces sp. NBC_01803]|uniref:sulfotransferase family protein n=1 Tax=Streptomyces sp. NBC_01803 TaxID=2975946 RepID=UPI002DD8612F|nr:sulfotransferase [Streptomyces sp. NBC_01803]WSA46812.1 sulfotransferase [Streptomyces sp. NBC_01803]